VWKKYYLLVIDAGSTGMKTLAYDLDGNVLARGSHPTKSIANNLQHPNCIRGTFHDP
jgi:sugar (pentulose or hexulose) kinase